MNPRRRHLLVAVALLALAFLVYGWSLRGEFLNWDDTAYVTDNPELELPVADAVGHILLTFHHSNYNPLHRLANLLEWKAGGGEAFVFRATNVALHALVTILLYFLLLEWLGSATAAVVAAVLFLVHPANVENAAWISEQKTLLAAGFGFGATLLHLRGRTGWALALFTVGLFAKTSIVVLAVLFPLLDLSRRRRPDPARTILFFIPAVVMGIIQVRAASAGDAVAGLHGDSLASHLATIVAVLTRYAGGLVSPVAPAGYHPYAPVHSFFDPGFLGGLSLLAVLAWAMLRSWRGERRLATAIAWALIFLLPTIVVPIPILYAERYLYLAMPLLLGLAAERLLCGGASYRLGIVVIVAAFAVGSALYATTWRSSVSMWERVVSLHPDDPKALTWLGTSLLEAGEAERAAQVLARCAALVPDDPQRKTDWAVAEISAGRPETGGRLLEEVVRESPGTASAWAWLARLRDRQGHEEEAARLFAAGIRACPRERILWEFLANFHRRHGREARAREAEERLRMLGRDRR